jgi:flagellar hook-associated protein 1 FlgK
MAGIALNIGLKSLLTSQAALDTIGHNIANANTPGYSRQNLHVSPSAGMRMRGVMLGTGIQADVVRRTVDTLLQARLSQQVSSLGRLDARLGSMSHVEALLGRSGETGVSALLQKFFAGLSTLSSAPEDPILRSGAVQSAVELTSQFNQLASNLGELRQDGVAQLRAYVDQVNVLAKQIGDLNRQILNTETGITSANDLRDRRDEAIKALSRLADLKVVEDPRGAVRVLIGGRMLVSPTTVQEMQLSGDPTGGDLTIRIKGESGPLKVGGGEIGGLLNVLESFLPDLAQEVDGLARGLILEVNRVHSTQVGGNGPFRALVGGNRVIDLDKDGQLTDELLANAGLPFEVKSGVLYVNVSDSKTGALEKSQIAIDASRTTVGDLLSQLGAIPHLSAILDGQGRVQVFADVGYGFDFSPRLDPDPDPIGSFGGGRASLATDSAGPFALADGDTLDLVGPSGPLTVTFDGAAFAQIGKATASELAAAVNADPLVQTNGLVASAVGGRLVLQTQGAGAAEGFTLAGGTALGALGWSAPMVVQGSDTPVDARISGSYTGAANGVLTFKPSMDGVIGTTPGLKIEVYDESGAQVAALDVGEGYLPGTELEVLHGVKLTLGFGSLSRTENDVFRLDVVADSDTSDVLPALGLNALFTGSGAESIGVREDIQKNPFLLAGSISGASGDASGLLALLALESREVETLDGLTLGERVGDMISGVGLEIASATSTREAEQFLLDTLQARRDQVSGVNVDEELVHMIEQEQAYNAAAQFVRVVNQLNDELLRLV